MLEQFRNAPNEVVLEVVPGFKIQKNILSNIRLALDGPQIDERFPLLMAYCFLARLVGSNIYDDALHEARQFLLGNTSEYNSFHVEPVQGGEYAPFHSIGLERNMTNIRVVIKLFEYVAFVVDFLRLRTSHPRIAYILDLNTKKHEIQNLDRDAPSSTD